MNKGTDDNTKYLFGALACLYGIAILFFLCFSFIN